MAKDESGNAVLAVLGLAFMCMCCFLFGGLFIKAQLAHGAASTAANAGALAATKALGDVFLADITPVANAQLDKLMQELLADPIYKKGDEKTAILMHTVPSQLQSELLAGHRGGAISLEALLAYRPFFSEHDLGQKLFESFQTHAEREIMSAVKTHLSKNGAIGVGTIRFPVHGRIEVIAHQQIKSAVFASLPQGKVHLASGRGYALFIKTLDSNGISYDISGLPVWQSGFD